MTHIANIAPACAWVARNAEFIKIDYTKIPEYTAFILGKYPLVTELDRVNHYISEDPEETAAYILALDSINFGSGYFSIAQDCGINLEYEVIAGGLKKAFEQKKMNLPVQWIKASAEDFSRLLGVPLGLHPDLDALLTSFARHLSDAGENLLSDYNGEVLTLLKKSRHSAVRLANIVGGWKGFWDIHAYKGRRVPILKRAQILASDINLALGGLKDMEGLTMFADNTVPHVLRCDGILEYAPALAAEIDGGRRILSGSPEEIEIRACAIHVVELMKAAAPAPVTSVNLDHLLWHRGYEPELYKKPRHRTLTTDY